MLYNSVLSSFYRYIMKLIIEKSVVVITPTIGKPALADAIRSVQEQTYSNIRHLIVADGHREYSDAMMDVVVNTIEIPPKKNIQTTSVPTNTGAKGINGQRIYAAFPHLVDEDYVLFLDDDNWFEPDHVKSLVELIEAEKLDWAHSLRKIYTPDKQFIADDNCEALGKWPIYFTHDNPQYLVDTSAYAFKREFIQATSYIWDAKHFACDRIYFNAIRERSKWNTTSNHSMCYRVDSGPISVNGNFFIEGNQKQLEHYKGELSWVKT